MLKNHLKIAWRGLLKNRITGFINIVGLAIGMAVALVIALWVNDELTYNQNHQNFDKVAQVYLNQTFSGKTRSGQAISQPMAPALRNEYSEDFEYISMGSWQWEHLLSFEDQHFLKSGMYVQPDFPKIFTLEMLAGSYDDILENPNSIVLSKSTAEAYFGNENPVGQTLRLDSEYDLKVTGVYNDLPFNSRFNELQFITTWDQFLNQMSWAQASIDNWGNHSFQCFVQIKDHATMEGVSAKIRDVEKAHNPNSTPEAFLHPMSDWHLRGEFKDGKNAGGRIQFVKLFGIIGIFVLILACINFMNLSTARSEKRAKEVGIRKSIGSMRGQLIGQFLSESVLVALIAMIFSLALVQIALPAFNELADKQMSVPHANPIFWAGLLGFTAFTGLLAGSYPAFYLSSFQPLKVLKGTFKAGAGASVPRKVLVTLQFTISVALIIGTMVVFQQIQHAKNRPVGYDKEGVIQFMSNSEIIGKFDVLKNEFLNTGYVEAFSASSGPITNIWSNQSGFNWEGKDPESIVSFGSMGITYDFGDVVNWDVLEGRSFSQEFSTDSSALILNEAAVDLVGMDDIVGKTIEWGDDPYQVVGVVKNMIMESPWNPIKPTIFYLSSNESVYTIKLKPEVPIQPALASIEAVYKKHAPSNPFEYQFADEEYGKKFVSEERIGKLARVFAILAIFISCLGLFGLSAFVAEQRTKEIGIRKVLGATVTNLWALQSKNFISLVLISCLIAIPIARYYLENWLATYDYRIELGWSVFAWAAVLALVVTLVTVSWQALKAALASPVNSLKSE